MASILIVEDDPLARDLVAASLMAAGIPNVTAGDGAEAPVAPRRGPPPALILLDIRMPLMDGRAVARELRTRLHRVPIVVITALAQPEREADRCNADAVLAKPFDEASLFRLEHHFAR